MAVSVNFYCNVGALASSFTLSSAECRRFLTTVSTKHAQTSFAAISVSRTSIFPASRATRKTSFLCCSFLTSGEQSSGRTTLRGVCCYDIINRLQSTPETPEHFTKWCGSRLRLKKALRGGNRVGYAPLQPGTGELYVNYTQESVSHFVQSRTTGPRFVNCGLYAKLHMWAFRV